MRVEAFNVEVTHLAPGNIALAGGPFGTDGDLPVTIHLETSKWDFALSADKEGRRVLDITLFSIRLWRAGFFGLKRVAKKGKIYERWVTYYNSPWRTFTKDCSLEKHFSTTEIKRSEKEIEAIAQLVNKVSDLENPILRRFGYLYFYPAELDRFLMLTMALDGLLHPVQKDCASTKENFVSRMNHLRGRLKSPPNLPPNVDHGDIYDVRNGLAHGKVFSTRTNTKDPIAELCCIYLDDFLRQAIHYFLEQDLIGDRIKRSQWLEDEGFPKRKKGKPR